MKKLILFGIMVVILFGCGGGSSSVDKAISQIDKAIEKLEKKKGDMTEEEWHAIEKEVEEPLKVIADALENDKVGAMAKLKIIAVTTKWATAVSQIGLKELEKHSGEFTKELENAAKELEKIRSE